MDKKFKEFEAWYLKRKPIWAEKGIFIETSGLGNYGHQYWIKAYSKHGLGNIILYESNGYYWVDFECGNYSLDKIFCKSNISFTNENDLLYYEQAFINYITYLQ